MYEHYFGFTSSPFLLIPDPAFLYPSRQHAMAETILEYGLESQAPFCLLTGEIGSGKSLLVSRLLRKLGDGIAVGLINNTHNRFRSIHGWVAAALGVQPRDESETAMHQALVDAFMREYAKGRRTLLVIDEAQNLSIELLEELRLLSNVNSEKDLLLQILLVGQPELRKKLGRPELEQFAQRVSVHFHLTALENSETHAYVRHRLQVARGNPDLFLPEAIDLVHAHTRGVPRLINQLCDFALAHAYGQGQTRIDAQLVAQTLQDPRGGFGLPPPVVAGPFTENSPVTTGPRAAMPLPVRAVPSLVPNPPIPPIPPIPPPPAPELPSAPPAAVPDDDGAEASRTDVWPYTNISAPSLTETAAVPSQAFALPEAYEAGVLPDVAVDEPNDGRLWLRDRQALASAGKAYASRRGRRYALAVAGTLAVIVAGVVGWQVHASRQTLMAAAAPVIPAKAGPAGPTAALPVPVAPASATLTATATPPAAPSPTTAPAKGPLLNSRAGDATAQRFLNGVENDLDAGDIAGAEQLLSQASATDADSDALTTARTATQQRRQQLASTADQVMTAIASGALLEPATDNAMTRLRDMQSLSRADSVTLHAQHELQFALLTRAQEATRKDDFEVAQRFLAAAAKLGSSEEVSNAQQQLRSEADRVTQRAVAATALPASTPAAQNDAAPVATPPLPAAASTAGSVDEPRYFAARATAPLDVTYPSNAEGVPEGYVTLEFTIGSDGHASDIAVIDAKPRGVFDRTAIAAVRHGHFDTKGLTDHPSERARLKLTFKPS